jgi:hypothetical protein
MVGGPEMVARGDKVRYRTFAGDIYDAVVSGVSGNGRRVDLDIVIPGVREPFSLRAIRWSDDPDAVSSCAIASIVASSARDSASA